MLVRGAWRWAPGPRGQVQFASEHYHVRRKTQSDRATCFSILAPRVGCRLEGVGGGGRRGAGTDHCCCAHPPMNVECRCVGVVATADTSALRTLLAGMCFRSGPFVDYEVVVRVPLQSGATSTPLRLVHSDHPQQQQQQEQQPQASTTGSAQEPARSKRCDAQLRGCLAPSYQGAPPHARPQSCVRTIPRPESCAVVTLNFFALTS